MEEWLRRRITGDPLADYPEFAGALAPRISDWRERRLCLCGCGNVTAINLSRELSGTPQYFKRGHHNKLFSQIGARMTIQDIRGEQHPNWKQHRDSQCITTLGLAEELREFCNENGVTLLEFARNAGITPTYLYEIRNRTRKRLTKKNFVKIMQAMGRPVHSSYLNGRVMRDCAWCGIEFLAFKHGKTCSDACRHAKWEWEQNGGKSAADLELAREYGV